MPQEANIAPERMERRKEFALRVAVDTLAIMLSQVLLGLAPAIWAILKNLRWQSFPVGFAVGFIALSFFVYPTYVILRAKIPRLIPPITRRKILALRRKFWFRLLGWFLLFGVIAFVVHYFWVAIPNS